MDCDWNNPGINPARLNDLPAMVSSYNYPETEVAELLEKIRTTQNDGVVIITKNGLISIGGQTIYLGDMHFRNGKCTGPLKISKWPNDRQEKALVYCSKNNNCVAIPTICGNVTRIEWQPRTNAKEPELNPEFVFNPIPEPSTMLLMGVAIFILMLTAKKF